MAAILGIITVTMLGCVFGIRTVRVERAVLEPSSPSRGRVVVETFEDLRPSGHRAFLGEQRNSYGTVLGYLALPEGEQLGDILADRIVDVLLHLGYETVRAAEASEKEASPRLEGDIEVFWMRAGGSYRHYVAVELRLRDRHDGRIVWDGRVEGAEVSSLLPGYTAIIGKAVDRMTVDAITQLGTERFQAAVVEALIPKASLALHQRARLP